MQCRYGHRASHAQTHGDTGQWIGVKTHWGRHSGEISIPAAARSSESRLGWARQTRGDVYSVYSLAALHSAYRGAGAGSSSCRGLVLLLQGAGAPSAGGWCSFCRGPGPPPAGVWFSEFLV